MASQGTTLHKYSFVRGEMWLLQPQLMNGSKGIKAYQHEWNTSLVTMSQTWFQSHNIAPHLGTFSKSIPSII